VRRGFWPVKEYLASPPLLSSPEEGEILYLYLVVSSSAVSSVLVREESGLQKLVYFTCRALHGAEGRYPRIEKLAFALITSARRLRPYFQAHAIRVLTEYPLKKVLQKPDLSGRLVNWAMELGEFDLEFHPRTTIKAQVLPDFIAELSNLPESQETPAEEAWIAYVDGSSMKSRNGAGVALITPDKEEIAVALKLDFPTTNNEAEYEAVIAGLSLAEHLGAKNLEIRSDSQVVVGHIQGGSEAKREKMIKYIAKVLGFWDRFERVVVTQIPRAENERADALARLGSVTNEKISASKHLVIIRDKPSMDDTGSMMQIDDAYVICEWARHVIEYLKNGQLSNDKKEARKIWMQSARYTLLGEILYRRGYTLTLLKCLSATEAEYVLKEIHEGVCGSHSGGRVLAHKAVRAGYYWPTMNQELNGDGPKM
jgi:ribonuclease HI